MCWGIGGPRLVSICGLSTPLPWSLGRGGGPRITFRPAAIGEIMGKESVASRNSMKMESMKMEVVSNVDD